MMKEPTKPINISISEKGLFFEEDQFNMLRYRLHQLNQKHHFIYQDNAENWNCILCYYFDVFKKGFISLMDFWCFDNQSEPHQTNYENIINYYKNTGINMEKLKFHMLYCNLQVTFSENEIIRIPTSIEFISYKCKMKKNVIPDSTRISIYSRTFEPSAEYEQSYKKTARNLFLAVGSNDYFKSKELIDTGANTSFIFNKFLTTPLDLAIVHNNPVICELLLKNGADVNHINGYGPEMSSLNLALTNGYVETARVLLKYGAKYDIFSMIKNNNYHLSIFLQAGGNPNKGIWKIFDPLMYSVLLGNLHATKMLLEHGADVNTKTVFDGTALRIAALMNNLKMTTLLLEYGAEINQYILSDLLSDNKNKYEAMIRLLKP